GWIREKPKNWEILKLRHCCEINPGKGEINSEDLEKEATFLPMEHIGLAHLTPLETKKMLPILLPREGF
ncbi:hypothetical protein KGY64_02700, partial [Candidatus Bipolaricaulota bacterium]|nr:hypothetical protein [Candidatus Bipolaricaulota bacterium]